MAKTIDQLAKEDARYWCSTPGSFGTKEELVTIGFIRGANTVLKMVEGLLPVSQIHSYHEVYNDIVGLVKQLKGE